MNTQLLRTASRSLAAAALLALSALPSYAQEKPAAHQDYEAPKVGKLEVVSTTPTTISLRWTPATDNKTPQNKLRYVLLAKLTDDPFCLEYNVGTGTTSYTIRHQAPEQEYIFNLLAVDEVGNVGQYYPPGQGLTGTTKPADKSEITPGVVTVGETSSTSITLNWTAAKSSYTPAERLRYEVKLQDEFHGTRYTNEQIGDTLINKNSYTFRDLQPQGKYKVVVKVYDEASVAGKEMFNQTITTQTDREHPVVKSFSIVELRPNSALFRWTGKDNYTPSDKLASRLYIIDKGSEGYEDDEVYDLWFNPGVSEHWIGWLKPNTKYIVSAGYRDLADNNGFSEDIEFTTPPVPDYEAPKASEWIVDEATDKSLRLLWMAATDNKTAQGQLRYRVGWKAKGEKEWTYSAVNPADWKKGITNFVIEDLKANTEYDVELSVMDEAENITSYGEKKGRTAVPNAIESVKAVQNKTAEVYGLDGTLRQEGMEEQPIGVYIIEGKKVIKP